MNQTKTRSVRVYFLVITTTVMYGYNHIVGVLFGKNFSHLNYFQYIFFMSDCRIWWGGSGWGVGRYPTLGVAVQANIL